MPTADRSHPSHCKRALSALGLALAAAGAAPVQALEVYAPLGLPGAGLGLALPMGDAWGLRADVVSLGQRSKSTVEGGIAYEVGPAEPILLFHINNLGANQTTHFSQDSFHLGVIPERSSYEHARLFPRPPGRHGRPSAPAGGAGGQAAVGAD
jgi:hypothetical protein